MNCSSANELLPWLLNGSLDAGERRQVEAHLAVCAGCQGELEQTRFAGAVYGAHPQSEALVAYVAGRPSVDPTPELVERHVAACPACAEEVALLRQSLLFVRGDGAGAEEDQEAEDGGGEVPAPVLTGPWTARTWRHLALAASFAGLVGLGVVAWTVLQGRTGATDLAARLQRTEERTRQLAAENDRLLASEATARGDVEELADQVRQAEGAAARLRQDLASQEQRIAELDRRQSLPYLGLPVANLRRSETVLRGEGEELPVVERAGGMALLNLPLPDGIEVVAVRLEILDDARRPVMSVRGPPPEDRYAASYLVALPTEDLAPESYTLRLWGEGDGEPDLLGTYFFQVE